MFLKNEEKKKKTIELFVHQKKRGVELSYLDRSGICKMEPHFSNDGILGAVYCSAEGRIEPFKIHNFF